MNSRNPIANPLRVADQVLASSHTGMSGGLALLAEVLTTALTSFPPARSTRRR